MQERSNERFGIQTKVCIVSLIRDKNKQNVSMSLHIK